MYSGNSWYEWKQVQIGRLLDVHIWRIFDSYRNIVLKVASPAGPCLQDMKVDRSCRPWLLCELRFYNCSLDLLDILPALHCDENLWPFPILILRRRADFCQLRRTAQSSQPTHLTKAPAVPRPTQLWTWSTANYSTLFFLRNVKSLFVRFVQKKWFFVMKPFLFVFRL